MKHMQLRSAIFCHIRTRNAINMAVPTTICLGRPLSAA